MSENPQLIRVRPKIRHDLRTCLNQILGYAELLEEESDDQAPASLTDDVGKIHQAARRMQILLDDLFAMRPATDAADSEAKGQTTPAETSDNLDAYYASALESATVMARMKGPERLAALRGAGEHILIVDDSEANREILSRRLEEQNYKTEQAFDGASALAALREQPFDLILLDIMMPGMDGIAALRSIREQSSLAELPVIMATALDDSANVADSLCLGANDYVTKPLDFPVVLARVKTHLTIRKLAQTKDEFLRIASHDLKSPLHAINLAAHALAVRDPALASFVSMLRDRVAQMKKIVEDFLDFQAMEDGRIQLNLADADLNVVARQTVQEQTEYAAGKGISLSADLDPNLPMVHADVARLEQVAANLIGNAIKFCPKGAQVKVRARRAEGGVSFEVEDNGPGLRPEDLPKLFAKYARLSNKPTGSEKSSGLGLAICKQIIDLHGGKIRGSQNDGPGSTFSFWLPVGSEPR